MSILNDVFLVAIVIVVAAVAGDFAEIQSLTNKIVAYGTVALAPSYAVHYKRVKHIEFSKPKLIRTIIFTSAISVLIALLILLLWRGTV